MSDIMNKAHVFNNFNFDSGEYTLYAFDQRNSENPKHFFLNDQNKLKGLAEKWVFDKKNSVGRCGYDYSLVVFNGEKSEGGILICFNCNSLIVDKDHTICSISESDIRGLIQEDFTPIRAEQHDFLTRVEGIKFWDTRKDDVHLLPNQILPDWLNFEGSCEVTIKLQNLNNTDLKAQIENARQQLNNNINAVFESGSFELMYRMCWNDSIDTHYIFSLVTNKSNYDKMEGFGKDIWDEFSTFKLQLLYRE
jgi:hypothetical protein